MREQSKCLKGIEKHIVCELIPQFRKEKKKSRGKDEGGELYIEGCAGLDF